MLINNADVSTYAPLVTGELTDVRREMETNYFGTLSMVRAFAPPRPTVAAVVVVVVVGRS